MSPTCYMTLEGPVMFWLLSLLDFSSSLLKARKTNVLKNKIKINALSSWLLGNINADPRNLWGRRLTLSFRVVHGRVFGFHGLLLPTLNPIKFPSTLIYLMAVQLQ